MTEQEKRKKIIKGLECHMAMLACDKCPYYCGDTCSGIDAVVYDTIALLKEQEPVEPILARGWYWCGGIGCRNSLTSALENDIPARKPNYCERCGRAVKWE